jgi:hypothetical protein
MLKLTLAIFIFFSSVYSSFAMPAGWNTRESQHFIIYYRNADKDFVDNLVRRSEKYYRSIPRNLGLKLTRQWNGPKRSKIYVYDTARQYQEQTNEPEWSDGSSIQRLRVIFSFSGAQRFSGSVFPHELAHIIFREIVGFENGSIPVWLEEGVASSQEDQDLARIELSLQVALAKGLLPSLESLQKIDPRVLKDKDRIDLFYGQSLSVVNFLISRNGSARFGDFCRALGKKKDLGKALLENYQYKDIRELDLAWQVYLKGRGR